MDSVLLTSRKNWITSVAFTAYFFGRPKDANAGPPPIDDPTTQKCPLCDCSDVKNNFADFLETLAERAYKSRPGDLAAVRAGAHGTDSLAYWKSIIASMVISAP